MAKKAADLITELTAEIQSGLTPKLKADKIQENMLDMMATGPDTASLPEDAAPSDDVWVHIVQTDGTPNKAKKSSIGSGSTGPAGTNGINGITTPFKWSSLTTDADPTSGYVRFDNATITSVAAVYIDNENVYASDVSALIDIFGTSTNTVKGFVQFFKSDNNWALFSIAGIADSTGYRTITVTYVDHEGSFSNDEVVLVSFSLTGDKGDTGAAGSNGTNGTNGTNGVSFTWQGTWSAAIYVLNDVVAYNGSTYIANDTTTSGDVPGVSSKWDLAAQKGATGAAGGVAGSLLPEPIAHFDFATSDTDQKGNVTSLSMTGTRQTATVAGRTGRLFDASNYLQATYANSTPIRTSNWTVNAWVRLTAAQGGANHIVFMIYQLPSTPQLYCSIGGNTRRLYLATALGEQNGGYSADEALDLKAWNMVTFTCEGDDCNSYVNGKHVQNFTLSSAYVADTTNDVYFGSGLSGASALNGYMEDLKYYDEALNHEQIQELLGFKIVGEDGSQPLDPTLTALAGLTISDNSLTIGTGADSFGQTAFAANTFPARASTGSLEAKPITAYGLATVAGAAITTGQVLVSDGTKPVGNSGLQFVSGLLGVNCTPANARIESHSNPATRPAVLAKAVTSNSTTTPLIKVEDKDSTAPKFAAYANGVVESSAQLKSAAVIATVGLYAQTATATNGYCLLVPGGSTTAGRLEVYKPGPTRIGLLGYGGPSSPDFGLALENSAQFVVSGGKQVLAAATTSYASQNIPDGVAPTSPVNGDIWFIGDVMYRRIGGVTKSATFTS